MYQKASLLFFCVYLNFQIASLFIIPTKFTDMETGFVFNGIEYVIYNAQVSWLEGQIICESLKEGSLAIVDTNKTGKFLAEALSETNEGLGSYWVGAQRTHSDGDFKWIRSDKILSNASLAIRGKSSVDVERLCLSFQRKLHDLPNFIDLECGLERPFICERAYEKIADGSMTTSEWIHIGRYSYGIFYDEKSWRQSTHECRNKHGAHLASFRNDQEVKLLGKFLLVGRPSLENAWIGGYFKNGVWKFISNGAVIPETVDNNTSFPPWRENEPIRHSGCLLLDRHRDNHNIIFYEARCERKRSYICTKTFRPPTIGAFVINNIRYTIFYTRKTWDDAFQACEDIDAKLLRVTPENLHDVTYMMGENATEIRHIWISGRLSKNGTHFYWVYEDEILPENNLGIGYYPPWYDNEHDPHFACLNMDRENHNLPIFYGAACDTPQEFICEQTTLSK